MGLGATLTSGIQDIAAFLPIFGTDQCERHIGSALETGFLYAAATPLSLFGCLGIVKASMGILFASITFPFNGPRMLQDAGFELVGSVAPMIGLAEDKSFEFEAARRVSTCLAENQANSYIRLTWAGVAPWNIALVFTTFFLSFGALTPYLPIIISNHGTVSSWIYPVLRIAGSSLCAVCVQFILQQQIRIILSQHSDGVGPDHDSLLLWVCRGCLVIGSGATAVGYIGCFNLVQNVSTHETFLWLGIETTLCLVRMFLWSLNPRADESICLILDMRSLVKPGAQTTTSVVYEDILPSGLGQPFVALPTWQFLQILKAKMRGPRVLHLNPLRTVSAYYTLILSRNGDTLYLLSSCLISFESVTVTALVLVHKQGQDGPVGLYRGRYVDGLGIRGQWRLELESQMTFPTESDWDSQSEIIREVAQHSATILKQFRDPTWSNYRMPLSFAGKTYYSDWTVRVLQDLAAKSV
ncbi:hypothetical protein C8F01DRAFT_1013029 [Mycena amicta]|nr:hypothetical protein C8F01DRAFT_1013029 [Mycena amicta]